MIHLLHIAGQILFGGYFVYSGINHFIHHKDDVAYAISKKVPFPAIAVYVTGALLVLGGLGIIFNRFTMWSSLLLVIFLIPTTIMMHAFWKETDPQARSSALMSFMRNVAFLGAVILLM